MYYYRFQILTLKYTVTFSPFILAHSGSVLVLAFVLFDMSCTYFCTNLIKKEKKGKKIHSCEGEIEVNVGQSDCKFVHLIHVVYSYFVVSSCFCCMRVLHAESPQSTVDPPRRADCAFSPRNALVQTQVKYFVGHSQTKSDNWNQKLTLLHWQHCLGASLSE